MKVCCVCGTEIDGNKDGDNKCQACKTKPFVKGRKRARSLIEEEMRGLGLVKARGALGGTYWE